MLLTRDHNHGDYEIHSYEPGEIKVNDENYLSSLVIGIHQLELWEPQNFKDLKADDFQKVLAFKSDIILLGTGTKLEFPKPKLLQTVYEHRVGIEIMATAAACRTFNVLMSEGRNVVAALLIR